MRTFILGDTHGAVNALNQCLDQVSFDNEQDKLIQLGDVVDGWPESYACIERLLCIKHLVALKGNHDDWFDEFIRTGYHPAQWSFGAINTAISYLKLSRREKLVKKIGSGYKTALNPEDIPPSHQEFFRSQLPYYLDEENNCFVHAGFNRFQPFTGQREANYYWDRSLWKDAVNWLVEKRTRHQDEPFHLSTEFSHIFLGHTNTLQYGTDKPMQIEQIFNLDTGAGHSGKLTIMDLHTKEYWQSDPVNELYRSEKNARSESDIFSS